MKLSEIACNIMTGDGMFVDGTGIVSDLIKLQTANEYGDDLSHAGVFFRLDEELKGMLAFMGLAELATTNVGDLWVGEMWYGKSFDVHPASKYISISDGKCFLGVAPAVVRCQPEKVLEKVKWFIRNRPEYGIIEFPKILVNHIFKFKVDPETILPVCSIALEECYLACGVSFEQSLSDPNDFNGIVAGFVEIEL